MKVQDQSLFTEQLLLEKLGPAPTVSQVARFLNESNSTTWRRLRDHQLQALPGLGTARINLKSLVALLNGSRDYEVTHKRGKKAGTAKKEAASK